MVQRVIHEENVIKEYDIKGLAVVHKVDKSEAYNTVRDLLKVNNQISLAFKNDFFIGEQVILVNKKALLPNIEIFKEYEKFRTTKKLIDALVLNHYVLPLTIFEDYYYGYKLVDTIKPDGVELKYLWKHHPNGSRSEIVIKDGLDVSKILCVQRDIK